METNENNIIINFFKNKETIKILKNILYIILIIVPQVLSEVYSQEWQTRAIYLIGSAIIIIFLNLENFEMFQVSKEGVKFKKVLKEAKETADDIKKMLETTLLLQIKQILITGGSPKLSSELYYGFKTTIIDNSIENEELRIEMAKLREQCLNSYLLDLNMVFMTMGDPKEDEDSKITEKMSQLLNNSYSKTFNSPKPEILQKAFDEMRNTQKNFLEKQPDWKEHYQDMYSSAKVYLEKYTEFYNTTI